MTKKVVTPFKKAAGERLERLRVALGFDTKAAFVKWLKIGHDTYRHYAEGRHHIAPEILVLLKERKGVPTDWLLHGDESTLPRWLADALDQVDTE